MDKLKMKNDVVFKAFFSSKKCEKMLHSFLSAVLDIPYESITKIAIENPDITPETVGKKFVKLDLKLTINGMIVDCEMQCYNYKYFKRRSLYYWSKMYSGQLVEGEEYDKLSKCIVINIMSYNLFDCETYESHFKIMETQRHETLTDDLSMHFFELKKINPRPDKNDMKQIWLNFINAESEEELQMIQNLNIPVMNDAVVLFKELSDDEKIKQLAEVRENALRDQNSYLSAAKEEGRLEGRAEGLTEVIRNMRNAGFNDDQIALAVGKDNI